MPVLKAHAVITDPATRDSYYAQALQAAASMNVKPGRDATVVNDDATGAIRIKAILTTAQEGNRAYNAVESRMVAAPVQPGSWTRLTADDGSLAAYREWPPMPA